MTALLWIVAVLLVIAGLIGTFVPLLPGTPLVFAGLFVAAAAGGFAKVGPVTLAILAFLTALSFAVDLAASGLGARRSGASRAAVIGAVLGALVGFVFGIPGLLLGPFVGALAGELVAGRSLRQAGRAGLGSWLGMVFGALAKLALSFTMVAIFLAAYVLD